jgi:archaellum component FlaC
LREQRLWKKFSENVVDVRITAINNQIKEEYKSKFDSYTKRIGEIKSELESIDRQIQNG